MVAEHKISILFVAGYYRFKVVKSKKPFGPNRTGVDDDLVRANRTVKQKDIS